MSYQAAQHLYVATLYCGKLRERIYQEPESVAVQFGLSTTEIHWFTQSDPRSFSTDTYRRTRALATVMEESRCSCSHLIRHYKTVQDLEDYFSSEYFHQVIRNRGSMNLEFFSYLDDLSQETKVYVQLRDLIRLEKGIALVRRAKSESPNKGNRLKLNPRVEIMTLSKGTLEHYQRTEQSLLAHPIEARAGVIDKAFPLVSIDSIASTLEEKILIELPSQSEAPTIETPPPALYELLNSTRTPQTQETLINLLKHHGADRAEGLEILQNLRLDGLLVEA